MLRKVKSRHVGTVIQGKESLGSSLPLFRNKWANEVMKHEIICILD